MSYTTILFDADDTLLDFGDAERQGIESTFSALGIDCPENIVPLYSAINLSFWKKYERGEIERSEIYVGRFASLKEAIGADFDPYIVEAEYENRLAFGHRTIEGAAELLSALSPKYSLYVITNGTSRTQLKRLRDAGIAGYFKDIFLSENIGFQKPRREYFNYVLSHIDERDKRKILAVGDSPSADIKGACDAGLDACWFNPSGKKADIAPTYEIKALCELCEVLK